MANSTLFADLVAIDKEVDRDVFEELVEIQLERRSDTRSEVTGEREFEAAVTVEAKVEGYYQRSVDSERSLEDAKHKVRLYEIAVREGDRLNWDDTDHTVLLVKGLLKDADGSRYDTMAVTN